MATAVPTVSELAVPGERTLVLSDGRTMAYSSGGAADVTKVAVMLHGVFGVGCVEEHSSRAFVALGWRTLAPTLPGWGRSSPWPAGRPVSAYVADVQELLRHTVGSATHVLVFGGSYGSVWAYACAANSPPTGVPRIEPPGAIRGLLILGGFSPYADESGYAAALDGMSTLNWLTVGRPGRSVFLSWIHGFVGRLIRGRLQAGGVAAGLQTLRTILTSPSAMTPAEREDITAWAAGLGTTFEAWEASMARNMVLSVRDTLQGYEITPGIINGDWGFSLADVAIPGAGTAPRAPLPVTGPRDVPATLPPVVIGGAVRDHLAPIAMQRWVAARVPGALMVELKGNHIAGITTVMPMTCAMIRGIEAQDALASSAGAGAAGVATVAASSAAEGASSQTALPAEQSAAGGLGGTTTSASASAGSVTKEASPSTSDSAAAVSAV